MALKLADAFPNTGELLMNLQVQCELSKAMREDRTPVTLVRPEARKQVSYETAAQQILEPFLFAHGSPYPAEAAAQP